VVLEVGGDLLGVLDMAGDAQAQRLQPLCDEEGVERTGRGTEVAQTLDAGLDAEGHVRAEGSVGSEIAGVDEAVVGLIGFVEAGEPLRLGSVVEVSAVDEDTGDRGAVTAEVL